MLELMGNVMLGLGGLFLVVQAAVAVVNAAAFPKLRARARESAAAEPLPRVSLLIPARNEAATLPSTLPTWLQQGATEVLVLDDGSEDTTRALLDAAAADVPELRVLAGRPLPGGWNGKNWACAQLAEAAHGDLLVFTDADVQWNPGALAALVALQRSRNAGLTTVWPRQRTVTLAERIAVPQVDMVLLGGLPHPLVDALPFASLAAANGQVMAWTRKAYAAVGGHAAVAGEVLEDVRLAQRAKRAGVRLALGLGADLIETRMYRSAREVIDGFAKNVLAGAGHPVALVALVVLNLLVYTASWFLMAVDVRFVALALGGVGLRALVAVTSGRRPWEAVLQPLAPLLLTVIAWRALTARGGYAWRGRSYPSGGAA